MPPVFDFAPSHRLSLDLFLAVIPPRHRIENEAFRKKEDVSPYALLWDGMGKSAGIGCSQI